MNTEILRKLEFTEGEIKVYIALLKLGKSSSGKIVDKSQVSKSKVYEILERLCNRGIVFQIVEDKVKVYQAMHPKELLNYYELKEKEFIDNKNELKKILPEYERLFNSDDKQNVIVYKGFEGIKKVMNLVIETLNENDNFYVFVTPTTPKEFNSFYDFDRKRVEKKIHLNIIYNENINKASLDIIKKKDKDYFHPKIIGKEFYTSAVFNIFGKYTAIIIWSNEPIAILIESKETAESFKKYFDIIWKIAKKYLKLYALRSKPYTLKL